MFNPARSAVDAVRFSFGLPRAGLRLGLYRVDGSWAQKSPGFSESNPDVFQEGVLERSGRLFEEMEWQSVDQEPSRGSENSRGQNG